MMPLALYRIDWTEHELGWGSRPDGSSLHLSKEVADKFIADYWARMPDREMGVPDCYSSPSEPFLVESSEELVATVKAASGSMWMGRRRI